MPKTVLLADDSVTIQKVVGITFANEDIELVTENNGDAALARAREITPDLILADVSMPGLNGYELCAAIRSEPRLARIPVILLTGTFESFDEQKTAEVGAAGHIAKPFEAQALVDLVCSTIERASRQPAAAAPPLADPGRTEVVGLSLPEQAPAPAPSFEAAPPPAAATPPTPVPSFEPPPAQPASAEPLEFAADPGRTEIVGLGPQGEDLGGPPPPAADSGFADFDNDAHAGEATRVYDPAQGAALAGDAELITPPAETSVPQLPSVDPAPATSSAPPSPTTPLATPSVSPDLPPSPAMGETPPKSSGLQGADTDVDAVLYEETAFLDPRAAVDEPPPAFQAPELESFGNEDGQRTGLLAPSAADQMNEETAPDPSREERAALAAAAALDGVKGPPPIREEPPDLELVDPVVQPEPLTPVSNDPLRDNAEPLTMSQVEMLGPPTQPALQPEPEPQPEPVALVTPKGPVAAAPEALELSLDTPVSKEARPDVAEVHAALEKVAWDAFGPVSEQIVRDAVRKIEEIAWEVIPQLTEKLIREEIARLKKDD